MQTFKSFIVEGRGVITATSDDHAKRYLHPHVGSDTPTHVLAKPHGDLKAGSSIKITKVEKDDSGKHHVHAEDESGKTHKIPASKLHKPGDEPKNGGHKYEADFVDRLKKHKVMPEHLSGAGSGSGTDFVAENKKKKIMHRGSVHGQMLNGETKNGPGAAMGQLTIHHSKEKGWHIKDELRAKRPRYAQSIEKAGILDHMNKHHPDPHKQETTASGRAKTVEIKHPDLEPAHNYLKDHHVHVLQVEKHGTYRVGDKDETGHGLPAISGKGKWRIREKSKGQKGARTVAFHPDGAHGLNKSHIDLDKDEHLSGFKKTLGHED